MTPTARLLHGDCLARISEVETASVDAVICDPPYPEINRPYGRMSEAEWDAMMRALVPEVRRVLKPSGSAVFILQPNSRKVGSMRPWLWEFMAWTCREWNMVQDAWWWNHTAPPMTKNDPNVLRASMKACVWLGDPSCYHDASSVRWEESDTSKATRLAGRLKNDLKTWHGGKTSFRQDRCYAAIEANGGVTPFNVLPIPAGSSRNSTGGHSAATPIDLASWWTRYITPPGGMVCDPFMGSGTMGLAALNLGRSFVGIERDAGYFEIAERRIGALAGQEIGAGGGV